MPDMVIHRGADESIGDYGGAHVWLTNLDEQEIESAELSILSTREHVRAARLKSPLERRRYIAGRLFTRRVLSNITVIEPENLEFCKDKCGKPSLSLPTNAGHPWERNVFDFNISHSENILGIAVAVGFEVGIDIEVINPALDVLVIAQGSLQKSDVDLVQRSPISERSLVFYRLWTRREAFAKMQGHGVASDHVSMPSAKPSWLRSFELPLGEREIVGSLSLSAQ